GGITFRVEAACMGFGEKAPRERVDASKDLVALALATVGPCGLLAFGRPSVAQRAPRGQAGLITTKPQSLSLACLPYNPRPLTLAPGQALGFMEMIRHQAGFLRRKPQVAQQGRDRVRMVRHAKATLDE